MSEGLHRFEADVSGIEVPRRFTWPFHYVPHRLSVMAAQQVMRYVDTRDDWADELQAGKMLGVLVVRDTEGELGFLAAYSGNLCGRNDHDYFVPPVYDLLQPDGEFRQGEAVIIVLLRDADQELIKRSQGKLRWIVIDEAHTYSGSAAVELSNQIRRILNAFGTTPNQVHFACTSATIGECESLLDFQGHDHR